MILEKINKPNDIKQLSPIEYNQLADEIRRFLIEKISKTGCRAYDGTSSGF